MAIKSTFVPPSSLLAPADNKKITSFNRRFANTPLRIGVITQCFERDNPLNQSGLVPEYTVITKEINQIGGIDNKTYSNCLSTDSFGGVADFFEYKLRPTQEVIDKDPKKVSHDLKKQNGSMVLILCIDGFSEKAIIIGGIPNVLDSEKQRETTLTPENGIHLEGEYNGVNWQINKDGEFTLTFKSATTNDGEYRNKGAGGTFFQIDQAGSVELNSGEGEEFKMKMDKDLGLIETESSAFSITTDNDVSVEASGNIFMGGSNFDLILEQKPPAGAAKVSCFSWLAETVDKFEVDSIKSVSIKSGAEMKIDSGAKLDIKSGALMDIDCGAILNMKGKTINIESNALVNIKGTGILVGGEGGLPAVTPSTVFFGIGNLGAPVLCNAVGPFSSTVLIKA